MRTIRGRVAVAGVGETTYYKHGQAPEPEVKLALRAILAACEDAGIDPRQIDGFASYSNDRNDPSRLAAALGLPELRFSNMQWGGGGGGGSAAVGNAAAAIAAGYADCVVVFRALAQGQFQRFGAAPPAATASGEAALTFPYGLISPAQRFAMKVMRYMHDHGIRPGGPARHRAGVLPSRAGQSARGDARPAAQRGGLRRLALDRRAVPAVRLLHGERRRRRARPRLGRARPRSAPAAGVPARRRPGLGVPQRRARPQRADLCLVELHHGGAAPVGDGRPRSEGRLRRAELRELHRRRAHEPGRARLLRAGGSQRVPGPSKISPRRAVACRSTPAAAISPSATCMASSCRSRRCVSCAGSPRTRCRARAWRLVISGPMVTPVSSMILGTEDAL